RTVLRIEVARRLVRQNQLRIAHHRASHSYALLLSTRELRGFVLLPRPQVHELQHLAHASLALPTRYVLIEQRQLDVLEHREIVDEIEALEHETQVPASNLHQPRLRIAGHVLAAEEVFTIGGRIDHAHDIQQSGFPAA